MARTCVGCQVAAAPSELVRLVLAPDGSLLADPRGGSLGRGAWVHPTPECVARGVPRGVARALRAEVRSDANDVALALRVAGERRAFALVGAAYRAKKAAAGSTAVAEAIGRDEAWLVVVARDARAAANLPAVAAAVAHGRGVVLGTKAELGVALGRPDTGVVAILDEGLGAALRKAVALAELTLPARRHLRENEIVTEAG